MDLLEMLARSQRNGEPDAPPILPEAAIMRLQEVAARYAEMLQGPRFKVGDIIVPATGGDIHARGPHIVVETRRADLDFTQGEVFSNGFGVRLDTRVIYVAAARGGSVTPVWVESFAFVPWSEEEKVVETVEA